VTREEDQSEERKHEKTNETRMRQKILLKRREMNQSAIRQREREAGKARGKKGRKEI
jgi:hypothetical protein